MSCRSKPEPPVTPVERFWSGIYGAFLTRFQNLDQEWTVVMTAAKLCAKRYGLDRFLQMLTLYGAPVVAERCRHELTLRQEFLARMLAKYPPEDPAEGEGAVQEMAKDLALLDSPSGALRLLRFLDRLRTRELMLPARKEPAH